MFIEKQELTVEQALHVALQHGDITITEYLGLIKEYEKISQGTKKEIE